MLLENLDNVPDEMVEYVQSNIAVNGNSNCINPSESQGHRLKAPAVSMQ